MGQATAELRTTKQGIYALIKDHSAADLHPPRTYRTCARTYGVVRWRWIPPRSLAALYIPTCRGWRSWRGSGREKDSPQIQRAVRNAERAGDTVGTRPPTQTLCCAVRTRRCACGAAHGTRLGIAHVYVGRSRSWAWGGSKPGLSGRGPRRRSRRGTKPWPRQLLVHHTGASQQLPWPRLCPSPRPLLWVLPTDSAVERHMPPRSAHAQLATYQQRASGSELLAPIESRSR